MTIVRLFQVGLERKVKYGRKTFKPVVREVWGFRLGESAYIRDSKDSKHPFLRVSGKVVFGSRSHACDAAKMCRGFVVRNDKVVKCWAYTNAEGKLCAEGFSQHYKVHRTAKFAANEAIRELSRKRREYFRSVRKLETKTRRLLKTD